MNTLNFKTLRRANMLRLPQFKNSKGNSAHSKPDGSDWSVSDWIECVLGELGELANKHKKFRRGDIDFEEWKVEASKEIADVAIYLDLLALRILDTHDKVHPTGIDLGQAIVEKFNEVSVRVGSSIRISEELRKNECMVDVYEAKIDPASS